MTAGGGVPELIGHYRIVSELGRGGMGVVYKAHEESLHRHVALKVLGEHLAADEDAVERFVREARAAARLNHPNIVQIYAISEDAGRHFFAMEYVAGRSLQQILRADGPLQPLRAARLMMQAAAGLEAAHEQGIIHRDIKPANLMVDSRGLLKVADFGLALAAGGAMSRLTATGMFMGTPGYLSPEQCLDEQIDHRTDIYSLGVTFFEALTGQMPFTADSPLALINKIIRVDPPDIDELAPGVPAPLRAVLERMMAKERDRRYQSCSEILTDLRAAVGGGSEDPATLAAGSVGVRTPAPQPTEAVRLETQPTQHMPSAAGAVPPPPPSAGPSPPPPPPPPPASVPAVDATEVITPQPAAEAAPPSGSAAAPPRRRSPVVLALVVTAVVLLGVAAAGLLAWRSGRLGGGSTPTEPAAVAALPPTTPTAGPTGAAPPPPGAAEAVPTSAATGGSDTTSTEVAGSGSTPAATAAGAQPRPAPARTMPAAAAPAPPRDRAPAPTATPEPAVAADGTVVIAVGEPLLAAEAERFVERGLEAAGETVVDERGIGGFTPPATVPLDREALLPLRAHARHLVVIRAEVVGQRELSFMGRSDVATRAEVAVSVVDLASQQRVGPPLMAEVEYTRLTLERSVAKELRPRMARILQAVR